MSSTHVNPAFSPSQDGLMSSGKHIIEQGYGQDTHVWVPSEKSGRTRTANGTSGHGDLTNSMQGAGSTLSIHDIRYSVKVRTKACFGSLEDKAILKNINASFRPGMNAILGPTGSGKSSLLDVLAGRKDPQGLKGTLLLDGCPPPENFKCMVGYVVQDDVVMGTLSVRENFQFSAALRLPKHVTDNERKERVDMVIEELGLTECAETKVGNEFIRGISGGERKRCNIGMELIISPPVLFLDEPTTGLDANTANTVMLLLKKLSLRGRTIIFSIHQPRYSIYRLFDSLVLLSKGETVFHGPAFEALDFFNTLGYPCQEHNNPPDFFLDVINGDLTSANNLDKALEDTGGNQVITTKVQRAKVPDNQTHDQLVNGYKKSTWSRKSTSELTPIIEEHERRLKANAIQKRPRIEYATHFMTQFGYVSLRTLRNLWRNPAISVMQVATMVIFGLVVGAIYWDIDNSCKSGLQNRIGAFFFIIMNMVFGNLSAVELFIKERAIFLHENVSGFYRVSAYFLAKIICDIIPMRLLPTSVFAAVTYFMIGLTPEADKFFVYVLGLFMVSLAASSISFCISALVRIFGIANLLIAMCYVIMMVFSGLLVNLDTIPDFLEWIKYISIFRYALQALEINELKGMTFVGNCSTGNEYLIDQGIAYDTDWDLWVNFVAMGCISVGFLFLTHLRLLFMNKLK